MLLVGGRPVARRHAFIGNGAHGDREKAAFGAFARFDGGGDGVGRLSGELQNGQSYQRG